MGGNVHLTRRQGTVQIVFAAVAEVGAARDAVIDVILDAFIVVV